MGAGCFAPRCDVGEHNSGAHNVVDRTTSIDNGLFDDFQTPTRLPIDIARLDGISVSCNRRCACDRDIAPTRTAREKPICGSKREPDLTSWRAKTLTPAPRPLLRDGRPF